MSVGHLDHVLTAYSTMEDVVWKSPSPIEDRAVNSQDVISMSDGHRNVVIR